MEVCYLPLILSHHFQPQNLSPHKSIKQLFFLFPSLSISLLTHTHKNPQSTILFNFPPTNSNTNTNPKPQPPPFKETLLFSDLILHFIHFFINSFSDTMEWYFGNEVEDLVVPKDYEQQEMMISSEESWSQWGMTAFGGSSFPKKNINMTREELTFNGGKNFYTSIDMADSDNERQKSNSSSMSQGLYNNGGSLLWNDQADFQQFEEEEARINHMDDIFFSSLLQEDQTKDSTEDHDNMILDNNANMFEGEMVNSHVGSHGQSIGSSKYLKTHAFSPSTDWGNGEVSTNCQMPKQYTSDENSTEESVLKDLERVTSQFTDKTRICFRDAFYRLAESSKQSLNSCQDGEFMLSSNDDTLRAGEPEVSESKTNVIDRAVANLMFNKFDSEDTDDQQHGAFSCQNQTDYNNDAEVPNQGRLEQPPPTTY